MRQQDRARLRALSRRFLTDTLYVLNRSATLTDFGDVNEVFTRVGSFKGLVLVSRGVSANIQQTRTTDAGELVTGEVRVLCEDAPPSVEWIEIRNRPYRVLSIVDLPYRVFIELVCKPRQEVV